MTDPSIPDAWLAPIRYSDEQSSDLVVYCGDGRFGTAVECFVREGLDLERCARLVIPGGPACLTTEVESQEAAAQFFFLVDALKIERVHLVAHDRCAFYMQRLGVTAAGLRARQVRDLNLVIERLFHERPHVLVEAWIAEVRDQTVAFIPSPIEM